MGEVVQFVPRPHLKRDFRTLEQQALEIINIALNGNDTCPCEMLPYWAPEKDPA